MTPEEDNICAKTTGGKRKGGSVCTILKVGRYKMDLNAPGYFRYVLVWKIKLVLTIGKLYWRKDSSTQLR